jgi:hypothetical protein
MPTNNSSIKKIPKRELILRLYNNGENTLEKYFNKMPV